MQVPSIICNDDDKLTDIEETSTTTTTIIESAPAMQVVSEEKNHVSGILEKGEKHTLETVHLFVY